MCRGPSEGERPVSSGLSIRKPYVMSENSPGWAAFSANGDRRLAYLPGASSMRTAFLCERGSVADQRSKELEARGHIVYRYHNELDLLRDVVRESFDVLLLDDSLRGLRCRSLVQRLKALPRFDGAVVFVNCVDDEVRLAEALAAGADDFVDKSASVRELEARLRAILRRRFLRLHTSPSGLQFGAYRFDPDGRLVYLDAQPIVLTRKEYELALFFFANEGRLVSRGHLLDMVWRRRASTESRTLDSHVSRVRRNLLLDRRRGFELVAVYGSGYRLDRCEEGVTTASPARSGQYCKPAGLCAGA